ncbi:MAG: c-type cytochrome [Nitrospirae bacterium]|nr:c-type cytochrome [Nitrospirota bacterium]
MNKTTVGSSLAMAVLITGISFGAGLQTKNPYEGNQKMIKEGLKIYEFNCKSCHGEGAKGEICPDLTTKKKKYGNSDADLFDTIAKGKQGGMPNWDKTLGTEKIWKVIAYLRSIEK